MKQSAPFEYAIEDFENNPYPIFERLREEAPVSWHEWAGAWFVVDYEDAKWLLTDNETFQNPPHPPQVARGFGGAKTILSTSGDEHRDLRASVEPPLRAARAREYAETVIRPIVLSKIENLKGKNSAELMSEYFEPISVRFLTQITGISGVDDDKLRGWFAGIVSGILNFEEAEEGFADSDRALADIREVVTPQYERLISSPDDSILSHMIHGGREAGNARSLEELIPSISVYLAGGMQEPGHGAGSTMYGLLSEPEQLERVKADPDLLTRVVQEGLRWVPPIGMTERMPLKDVEVHGTTIPAGDTVFVFMLAANRDPAVFENPDRFDIDREEGRILTFGGGEHLCAGHFVARHVLRISIEELLKEFPNIRFDESKESNFFGFAFRAPSSLNVLLSN